MNVSFSYKWIKRQKITMTKVNTRSIYGLILISLLSLLLATFTFTTPGEGKKETGEATFPFDGAKAIYTVEGTSPFGHLLGTLKYKVEVVEESSYTVKITTEGNISKIPNLVERDTRKLAIGDPLSFSGVIEKSTLAADRILKTKDREIKVDKYVLESKKEYGREKITIFIPEKVKIPLIINYRYGDRFNVVIELDKTNVEYLQ